MKKMKREMKKEDEKMKREMEKGYEKMKREMAAELWAPCYFQYQYLRIYLFLVYILHVEYQII